MKEKTSIHAFLLLAFSVLLVPVYAEDVDGAAVVASQGSLPGTGFFAASNSFSPNATVNVTNLDNGKTTQVVVAKGLENTDYGFLLTLSQDAANAIGLYGRDIGRIRVTLPTDSTAFSRYNDGRSFSGDPDYDPRAFIRSNSLPFAGTTLGQAPVYGQGTAYSGTGTETVQPFHTYSPIPDNTGKPSSSAPAAMASSVVPYSGPGETGVILRSPDLVLSAPLPELAVGTEGKAYAYSGEAEPSLPVGAEEDRPSANALFGQPFESTKVRDIATDQPDYAVEVPPSQETAFVETNDIEDVPAEQEDRPSIHSLSSEPFESLENAVRDEPGFTASVPAATPPRDIAQATDTNEGPPSIDILFGEPPEKAENLVVAEPNFAADVPAAAPSHDRAQVTDANEGPPSIDILFGEPPEKAGNLVVAEPNFAAGITLAAALPDDTAQVIDANEGPPPINTLFGELPEAAGDIVIAEPNFAANDPSGDTTQATDQLFDEPPETVGDIAVVEPNYAANAPSDDTAQVIDANEGPPPISTLFGELPEAAGNIVIAEPNFATNGPVANDAEAESNYAVAENDPVAVPSEDTAGEDLPSVDRLFRDPPEMAGNIAVSEPNFAMVESGPVDDAAQAIDLLLGEPLEAAGNIAVAEPNFAVVGNDPVSAPSDDTASEDLPSSDPFFAEPIDTMGNIAVDEPAYHEIFGVGGGESLPSDTQAAPGETNADATAPFTAFMPNDNAILWEPGYAILEPENIEEKPEDGTALADVAAISDNPPASNDGLFLGEPDYTILGTEDSADMMAGAGEPASAEGVPPGEQGYAVTGEKTASGLAESDAAIGSVTPDETLADAASITPDDGIQLSNAILAEPRYRLGEQYADVASIESPGTSGTGGQSLVEEPQYTFRRDDADSSSIIPDSGAQLSSATLAEPRYRMGEQDPDVASIEYAGPSGTDGQPLFGEPGYRISEQSPDVASIEYSGPSGTDGQSLFGEPGYQILDTEDEADAVTYSDESAPAEQIVLGEPGYTIAGGKAVVGSDETGLAESGRATGEAAVTTTDETLADSPPLILDSETRFSDAALAEPGYRISEQEPDAANITPDSETQFSDTALTEPGFQMPEDETMAEFLFGIGGSEEFPRETTPQVTVSQPEVPEYSDRGLTPVERTTFPFTEPGIVNIETLGNLEKGKYYVQIGGYANIERVKAVMAELSAVYPLVLMGGRYILVGPLNEGESNAIELRFRINGFPNAFVVRGK
jgi:hypothetical protein